MRLDRIADPDQNAPSTFQKDNALGGSPTRWLRRGCVVIGITFTMTALGACGAGGGLSQGDRGACAYAGAPVGGGNKGIIAYASSIVTQNQDIRNEIAKVTFTSSDASDAQA